MLLGVPYVFREPNHGELARARQLDDLDSEEYLCSQCVIYPKTEWSSVPAGIPTVLARGILELGGLTENARPLIESQVKEWSESPEGKQEILMMAVLKYLPKDISEMNNHEWNQAAAAAVLGSYIHGYGQAVNEFLNPKPQQAVARSSETSGHYESSRPRNA